MSEEQERRKYNEMFIQSIVTEAIEKFTGNIYQKLSEMQGDLLQRTREYVDTEVGKCKACEIFAKDKNVESFYTVTGDYKGMIMRTTSYKWVIGLISAALITLLCKLFGAF